MADKLVFMCTHDAGDPERATIPFVMATAAQASEMEVLMGFQADGVRLATKGYVDQIHMNPFPALAELFKAYRESGGKLYVCSPCMQARNIKKEDLVEGATVVSAATFVSEISTAKNALVY